MWGIEDIGGRDDRERWHCGGRGGLGGDNRKPSLSSINSSINARRSSSRYTNEDFSGRGESTESDDPKDIPRRKKCQDEKQACGYAPPFRKNSSVTYGLFPAGRVSIRREPSIEPFTQSQIYDCLMPTSPSISSACNGSLSVSHPESFASSPSTSSRKLPHLPTLLKWLKERGFSTSAATADTSDDLMEKRVNRIVECGFSSSTISYRLVEVFRRQPTRYLYILSNFMGCARCALLPRHNKLQYPLKRYPSEKEAYTSLNTYIVGGRFDSDYSSYRSFFISMEICRGKACIKRLTDMRDLFLLPWKCVQQAVNKLSTNRLDILSRHWLKFIPPDQVLANTSFADIVLYFWQDVIFLETADLGDHKVKTVGTLLPSRAVFKDLRISRIDETCQRKQSEVSTATTTEELDSKTDDDGIDLCTSSKVPPYSTDNDWESSEVLEEDINQCWFILMEKDWVFHGSFGSMDCKEDRCALEIEDKRENEYHEPESSEDEQQLLSYLHESTRDHFIPQSSQQEWSSCLNAEQDYLVISTGDIVKVLNVRGERPQENNGWAFGRIVVSRGSNAEYCDRRNIPTPSDLIDSCSSQAGWFYAKGGKVIQDDCELQKTFHRL